MYKAIYTLATATIIQNCQGEMKAGDTNDVEGEQEQDVIGLGIFYYAQVQQHQVAPDGKVRDIVMGETAESTSCEPMYGQGWLSKLGVGLSNSCGNRGTY